MKPRELMSVGSVESIVVGGKDSDGTGIAGLILVFEGGWRSRGCE